MPDIYAISGQTMTDIGDAIREKGGTTEPITPKDMAEAIRNIHTGAEPEPLEIQGNGTWESPNGFSPVTAEMYALPMGGTLHLVNGKWVCPDDWDDVEKIPLPDDPDAQVLYAVFRTDVPLPFISFGITAGAYKYRLGHAVGSEFVPTTDWVILKTGAYVQVITENDFEISGKNTIVLHIEPLTYVTKLTGTRATNWTAQNISSADYNPLVIRYGQLPYATSLSGACYMLECENIRGCRSITSLNGYMNYNKMLQKWRHDGWVLSNCTSFANMLAGCRLLEDIDPDLSGFVTSKATSLQSMFSTCLRIHKLDVSGWDTSNVTSIATVFASCYNLTDIIGIEDWQLPKCNTLGGSSGPFSLCYSLAMEHSDGVLDLSGWRVGEAVTANITMQNMFSRLPGVREIRINGWNLSRCTSANGMFGYCSNTRLIDMRGIVPPSGGLLTSISSMFVECYLLKEILTDSGVFGGWDLKSVNAMGFIFDRCVSLEEIDCGQPAVINATAIASNVLNCFVAGAVSLKRLDMSGIDAGIITTSFGTVATDARWLEVFLPPKRLKFNWNISYHPYLGRDSLLATIDALEPTTVARTLTLGGTLKSKLTDEELAVATQKGWTIA